jgi:hypothetical protein
VLADRKLTDQEIIDLYFSGLDADAVGYRAGCHPSTVLNLIKRAGLKPRRRGGVKPVRPIAWTDDKIEAEYHAGMTITALAEQAGSNRENIRRLLVRRGVRLRTAQDYATVNRISRRRATPGLPKA